MTSKGIAKLGRMKVNQLQAMFAEVVGETTRSPNRVYLIKRIKEAMAINDARSTRANAGKKIGTESAPKPNDAGNMATTAAAQLSKLDVPTLQSRYLEIVGRPTGSTNRAYLVWKIREAQKGRIPVGPRQSRRQKGGTIQVLPLRMETELVERLDDAWRRLGLRSRMDLIRRSLRSYLVQEGETEMAALLVPEP